MMHENAVRGVVAWGSVERAVQGPMPGPTER
jgi:hypothetical protein